MGLPLEAWILGFSVVGGVFSLVGGVVLLVKERWTKRYGFHLVSFAAGVLVTVAFLELLPEAIHLMERRGSLAQGPTEVLGFSLAGIVLFFLLERSLIWFHHHHEMHVAPPAVVMLVLGDTLHNFLDGLVIAATFLVSIPLGVLTALAVAAHEIPQEIADFGVMLSLGMKKWRVFWINLGSALGTLVGAGVGLVGEGSVMAYQPELLAFTGGMFTYIAAADLIPELHRESGKKEVWGQTAGFLAGVGLVWVLGKLLG